MKRFGLIGHPIGHSVSPAVFRAGYKGKPYTYDLIEGADFEESYRRFMESYDGINVTAPFKEPAFACADIHSPECEAIGATNLLIKTPEGVKAYNTDYYGIIFSILLGFGVNVEGFPATPSAEECRAALGKAVRPASESQTRETEKNLTSKTERTVTDETERERTDEPLKALVVGCGGAGKAAATAAVGLGFDTTVINRTTDKAFDTAERITSAIARTKTVSAGTPTPTSTETPTSPVGQLTVRPIEELAKCFAQSDLIIYTLPCPINALEEIASTPIDQTATATDATNETATISRVRKVIIEANYRDPAFTPELTAKIQARYPEARFIRGNVWHLYQAWSGYILFTGETPDLAAMAAVDR